MAAPLADLVAGVLDLLFAPVCVACTSPISTSMSERGICRACWARARPIPGPRCERCWTPPPVLINDSFNCSLCPQLRPAVRAIRSAFLHEEPVKAMVHALKYGGWHTLALCMAARMSQVDLPREVIEDAPVVVPVPIGRARLRQRGYNQAALLAEEVARSRGWKSATDVLSRRFSAGTQTALHRFERRANVSGAFGLTPGRTNTVAGKHVLLVDDVWTTGATSLTCADALLDGGARAVTVLTFARALPDLTRQERRRERILLN